MTKIIFVLDTICNKLFGRSVRKETMHTYRLDTKIHILYLLKKLGQYNIDLYTMTNYLITNFITPFIACVTSVIFFVENYGMQRRLLPLSNWNMAANIKSYWQTCLSNVKLMLTVYQVNIRSSDIATPVLDKIQQRFFISIFRFSSNMDTGLLCLMAYEGLTEQSNKLSKRFLIYIRYCLFIKFKHVYFFFWFLKEWQNSSHLECVNSNKRFFISLYWGHYFIFIPARGIDEVIQQLFSLVGIFWFDIHV